MSTLNKKNSPFAAIVQNPIINFSSIMDNRTSSEVLNANPNDSGFAFTYLQNGDLFNTYSLSTRPGSINICSSVGYENNSVINEYSIPTSGNDLLVGYSQSFMEGQYYDRIGGIVVNDNASNLFQVTCDVVFYSDTIQNSPINMFLPIYQINGIASGTAIVISGNTYDMALSGTYNSPPFPVVQSNSIPMNFVFPQDYAAQSTNQQITPVWSGTSGNYQYETQITFQFDPPIHLASGLAYALFPCASGLDVGFYVQTISTISNDLISNIAATHLFEYIGGPSNQNWALEQLGGVDDKYFLTGYINQYKSPQYMLVDNPTASANRYAPMSSGVIPYYEYTVIDGFLVLTYEIPSTNQKVFKLVQGPGSYQFDPSHPNWPVMDTYNNFSNPIIEFTPPSLADFGQIINIPSGNWNIYGGYFYANTQSASDTNGIYTNTGMLLNPSGYTIGYTIGLSEIISSSGQQASGTYGCAVQPLCIYSGTYTFTNPVSQTTSLLQDPTCGLEKLQAVFQHPVNISGNGGQYMLEFGFYSAVTGGPCTDYYYNKQSNSTYTTNNFVAPILVGWDQNQIYSGCVVINNNNDGINFEQNPQPYFKNQDAVTCGLIYLPSGIGITSIYNYEVEDYNSQRIIVTQQDKVYAGIYGSCEWTPILSGATIDNNLKWTHTSFQNQLMSHQFGVPINMYGGSGGAIWDMDFINNSGNSMQLHGLQPQAEATFLPSHYIPYNAMTSTGNTIDSTVPYYPFITAGMYTQIMLATQLLSGGIRAGVPIQLGTPNLKTGGVVVSGDFGTGGLYDSYPSPTSYASQFVHQGANISGTYLQSIVYNSPYQYNGVTISGESIILSNTTIVLSGTVGTTQEFSGTFLTPTNIAGTEVSGSLTISNINNDFNPPLYGLSGNFYGYAVGSNYNGGYLLYPPNSSSNSGNPPIVGTFGSIELSGVPIYNSGTEIGVETQWSLNDVQPDSTYVFATQAATSPAPSGTSPNLYYLAAMIDSLGNPLPNPLPNIDSFNVSGNNATLVNPSLSGTNLGSGTYIVDITANALTEQIPQVTQYSQAYFTEQVPIPSFKFMCVFQNYICAVGDVNNPSRLWISQNLTSNIFGTDGTYCNFIDIDLGGSPSGPNNASASKITGMMTWKDFLYIFKYNATYRLSPTGNPLTPFQVTVISTTIGSLGFFSLVPTDDGIYGLSQFGPFLAGYYNVQLKGQEILPYYASLNHDQLELSQAIYDGERSQIYWSISPSFVNPDNNIGLTYSYVENKWNIRQSSTGMWNAAGIIEDTNNFNQLYVGDLMGNINQISVGNSDTETLFVDGNGTTLDNQIILIAQTPWLNFGDSQTLKRLKSIRINCATSNTTLRADFYTDQDSNTIKFTRFMRMNSSIVNRVLAGGGPNFRTLMIVFSTVGTPDYVELKSMECVYQDYGPSRIL